MIMLAIIDNPESFWSLCLWEQKGLSYHMQSCILCSSKKVESSISLTNPYPPTITVVLKVVTPTTLTIFSTGIVLTYRGQIKGGPGV